MFWSVAPHLTNNDCGLNEAAKVNNNALRTSGHLESLHHPLTQTDLLRRITGGLLWLEDPTWTHKSHPAEAAETQQWDTVWPPSAPWFTWITAAAGWDGETDGWGVVTCWRERIWLSQYITWGLTSPFYGNRTDNRPLAIYQSLTVASGNLIM